MGVIYSVKTNLLHVLDVPRAMEKPTEGKPAFYDGYVVVHSQR